MLTVLKRAWVPLVVVGAVILGGIAVAQLREAFGSEAIFSATGRSAEPLEPFNVKHVTYELYGPADTAGTVSYLDSTAQPQQTQFTGLPWTFTIATTVPAVIANVVAQGDGENLGCRITVNGQLKDEQSSNGRHAQTSCLVKAA